MDRILLFRLSLIISHNTYTRETRRCRLDLLRWHSYHDPLIYHDLLYSWLHLDSSAVAILVRAKLGLIQSAWTACLALRLITWISLNSTTMADYKNTMRNIFSRVMLVGTTVLNGSTPWFRFLVSLIDFFHLMRPPLHTYST